jgi:hypothetical protein
LLADEGELLIILSKGTRTHTDTELNHILIKNMSFEKGRQISNPNLSVIYSDGFSFTHVNQLFIRRNAMNKISSNSINNKGKSARYTWGAKTFIATILIGIPISAFALVQLTMGAL